MKVDRVRHEERIDPGAHHAADRIARRRLFDAAGGHVVDLGLVCRSDANAGRTSSLAMPSLLGMGVLRRSLRLHRKGAFHEGGNPGDDQRHIKR